MKAHILPQGETAMSGRRTALFFRDGHFHPKVEKFADLREKVLSEFDLTREDLESDSRDRTVVIARTALVNLCRERTTLSYQQLARLMKRNYTTLVTAEKRGNDLVRAMECYRRAVTWDA